MTLEVTIVTYPIPISCYQSYPSLPFLFLLLFLSMLGLLLYLTACFHHHHHQSNWVCLPVGLCIVHCLSESPSWTLFRFPDYHLYKHSDLTLVNKLVIVILSDALEVWNLGSCKVTVVLFVILLSV